MYTFVEQETGPLKVFSLPEPGMVYTMGIDAATGFGKDYSVAQILTNTLPCEQVAVYRGQVATNVFSEFVNQLGRFYNEALNVCEVNYPGNSVQEALLQYYRYPRNYQAESHLDEDIDVSSKYGFRTTEASKWLLINEMQIALEEGSIIINDLETIAEFNNFVYQHAKNKAGAAAGFNDDRVMALMLSYHGVKLYPFIRERVIQQKQHVSTDVDAKKCWRIFRENLNITDKEEVLL